MSIYTIASIILTLAVLISYINHRFVKLETITAITAISFLLSLALIIIGQFSATHIVKNVAEVLNRIPFHALLINGILGFLLFAGAMRIDINHLRARRWEITVLAVLGTIVSTLLVGIITYYALPLFGIHLRWIYCMLFGALISPTDPIAVLATFKEMGAPKSLQIIVEGEALFNDGLGIVIFLTLYQLAFNGHPITPGHVSTLFLHRAVGGLIYGAGMGWLAYQLIKPIDCYKIEILITLVIVTAGYTLAQSLNISGPLAIVVAGIFIGNKGRTLKMSAKTVNRLYDFWELIEEILNITLFLLIGLELLTIHLDEVHIIAALFAIPTILLIRTIIVSSTMKYFKKRRRYPTATTRILIWGGLRGALPFALALSLPSGHYRNLIITMTYAVVAFSIIIQGITIRPLVKLSKQERKSSEDQAKEPAE